MEKRSNFGSRLAGVLVAAGSAVGLGNLWRFPYELGRGGGAAFLLVYVVCILLFGLPLMIGEFAVGRHARSNAGRAFGAMGGSRHWQWVGLLGVVIATLILCYYGVVAGWALEYMFEAGVNEFAGKTSAEFATDFNTFISDPMRPVVCMAVFMMLNLAIILAGVKGGIERGSKVLMPLLFIFVVVLAGCSVFLIDSSRGLEFLLKPDFSKLTPGVLLSAMGQVFYSLSIAMGILCTYASYFRKTDNLVMSAVNVAVLDTLVALLAAFIIFPAVFSAGIEPGAGPSLAFITLPYVFQQIFVGQPLLCYVFSFMFYALLLIATVTSTMSLLEAPTIYVKETFGVRRRWSAIGVTGFCVVVGTACSLSMGVWSGFTIAGMNLFDLFDFVTAKVLLPVSGLLTALYIGWFCNPDSLRREVTNDDTIARWFYPVFRLLIRYVAPAAIVGIFLDQFGVI